MPPKGNLSPFLASAIRHGAERMAGEGERRNQRVVEKEMKVSNGAFGWFVGQTMVEKAKEPLVWQSLPSLAQTDTMDTSDSGFVASPCFKMMIGR